MSTTLTHGPEHAPASRAARLVLRLQSWLRLAMSVAALVSVDVPAVGGAVDGPQTGLGLSEQLLVEQHARARRAGEWVARARFTCARADGDVFVAARESSTRAGVLAYALPIMCVS